MVSLGRGDVLLVQGRFAPAVPSQLTPTETLAAAQLRLAQGCQRFGLMLADVVRSLRMIDRRAPVMRPRVRLTSAGTAMSPDVDMSVPRRGGGHWGERRRQGISVRRWRRRDAGGTLLLRRLLIRSSLLRRRRGGADRQKQACTDEGGAAHQWFHRRHINLAHGPDHPFRHRVCRPECTICRTDRPSRFPQK